jgi:hypothetical protein
LTQAGKDTPMTGKHIAGNESKRIFYAELEEYARDKIREHLQELLEQEVSEWLAGEKRAQVKFFGAAGVSQRLGQAEAVYDEPRDSGDSPAAGEKFG